MKQLLAFLLSVVALAVTLALLSPTRARADDRPKIDLVVAIDTTGSMGDEIVLLRKFAWDLANGLLSVDEPPELQLGLVRFRDRGDDYVTRVTPLSRDLDQIYMTLKQTEAGGGGDGPEHVSRALHDALKQPWRPEARRLIVLIGDASPHDYGDVDWRKLAQQAGKRKIAIHTVGCSGIDAAGQKAFRAIAQRSGGEYTRLPTDFSRAEANQTRLRDLILERAGLKELLPAATAAAR